METSELRACRALLILATAVLLIGADRQYRDPIPELYAEAEELTQQNKFLEASSVYRKLLFARPGDAKARKKLDETNARISDDLVQLSRVSRDSGIEYLRRALRLCPQHQGAMSILRARGHELYGTEWLTAEQFAALQRTEDKRAEQRRSELGLGAEFIVFRLGDFRVFSDLAGGRPQLEPFLAALEAQYSVYQILMAPFIVTYAREGLDVVFFQKREDYQKLAGSGDRLGLYLPKRGASAFCLTGESGDMTILLHEVARQLQEKVGLLRIAQAAFEDGAAEYFSCGPVASSGKRVEIGKIHAPSAAAVRDAIAGRAGSLPPIDEFLLIEKPAGDLFHAQSWALFHYLMHVCPNGRLMLFDLMAATSLNAEVRRSLPEGGFGGVLHRYGVSMKAFDEGFRKYFAASH